MQALLFTLLVATGTAASEAAPVEIVKNPGFDQDADDNGLPDHWSTSHGQVRWREQVYMGKDYEVISQPGQYVLATQDIALEKGQRYTITIRCRAEGGGLAGALIVHGEKKPTREMPLIWRVEPAAEYEELVGTFIAPNPVARLYIYNVAKTQGTVYYDRVSIREGGPDRVIITRLSFRKIDRPLTDPPQRRHIDWASPLAGGPVKAFITIRTFRCLRQVVELAQRIDLDYDVVHTGYDGLACVSPTGRRAMQRLKERSYDVYVVPSRCPDILVKSIRERVEAGAGLVIVEGFGRASRFVKPDRLQEAGDAHYLRRGIPWDMMPEKILQSVQVGALGRGRVVRLVFPLSISRVWGSMPTDNTGDPYKARQFEYWEWWESLMAKAVLWAAGREGDAWIEGTSGGPAAVSVSTRQAPPGAKVRAIIRSAREIRFDGPLIRTKAQVVPIAADGTATFAIPEHFPAGRVIADAVLVDRDGKALTWCSGVVETPQALRITELAADDAVVSPDAKLTLALSLDVARARKATLEAKLVDAFRRVVSVVSRDEQLTPGAQQATLSLTVRRPIGVHHKAFVRVLVDGVEQDSRWLATFVPAMGPKRAAADFLVTSWAPGMSHPVLLGAYAERARELGLTSEFAIDPYLMGEHGMPGGGYVGGMGAYRESEFSADGVRSRCLSDPAIVDQIKGKVRESAEERKRFGLFGVGITDEAFLTSRHKRHEVCFSPHCQARYREWLQRRYKTLDRLNAQWDTAHKSWDEIRGMRTEEARGRKNFGPFVDFRTCMTDVWIDACKTVVDAYHEVDPAMPIGHTNTFGANPFNGNDYWKLATKTGFAWGQEYSEAIKPTGHKAIFDLWHSFVETPEAREDKGTGPFGAKHPTGPTGQKGPVPFSPSPAAFFNYGWIGYHHVEAAAHYEPWWLALHGSRGLSYFATNAMDAGRGISWALVYPTLALTPFSMAVKDALADLRAGCGKIFMAYRRERPPVALLWSHPSMLVAWCESRWDEPVPGERDGTDSYGSYFRSALDFRQHLNELQLDYTYVAPEQVLTSNVLDDYSILILPFTVAASSVLVDRLVAYVEGGGVVVGDLRCLRTDEHGKPFATSDHLERLFGLTRRSTDVNYGKTTVRFTEATEGVDLRGRQADLHGREDVELAGATGLGTHATGEPALTVHRLGKGVAVYLNFSLPSYDALVRTLLEQLVRRAGIERTVVAENPEGDTPPRCYERNSFTRGPITVHAFIRDHRRCSDSDPVRFRFGEKSHVYDMRRKAYIGHVDAVETTVAPGQTALYACLPYRTDSIAVSVPEQVRVGAELTLGVRLTTTNGDVGDHVVHVELLGPDGEPAWHYTQNLVAKGGRLDVTMPLAVNEQTGRWAARVRDVLTGVSGAADFTVIASR